MEKAFLKKDIYGKPVYTLWKWVQESNWISQFAQMCSTKTFINATEGGIGFKGIDNMPLKEVSIRYLTRSRDLSNRIHAGIQQLGLIDVNNDIVVKTMKELKESLCTCRGLCMKIVQEMEKAAIDVKYKAKCVLEETMLYEELAFVQVMKIVESMYDKIVERKQYEIDKSVVTMEQYHFKMMKVQINKVILLQNIAEAHIKILQDLGV